MNRAACLVNLICKLRFLRNCSRSDLSGLMSIGRRLFETLDKAIYKLLVVFAGKG